MTGDACKECGRAIEPGYPNKRRSDVCFECNFWFCYVDGVSPSDGAAVDPLTVVRIKGQHFIIGPDQPKDYRGFVGHSGRRFVVRFTDGRVVETQNLWSQSAIPERFRARLKDNAIAIEGMSVLAEGTPVVESPSM